jgi:hypothetical protein
MSELVLKVWVGEGGGGVLGDGHPLVAVPQTIYWQDNLILHVYCAQGTTWNRRPLKTREELFLIYCTVLFRVKYFGAVKLSWASTMNQPSWHCSVLLEISLASTLCSTREAREFELGSKGSANFLVGSGSRSGLVRRFKLM